MSRIGKKPVTIPDGVSVSVDGRTVSVKKGSAELKWEFHPSMTVAVDTAKKEVNVTRPDDQGVNRALHGLTRALIQNMVLGVIQPFEKKLEIVGVGYQASVSGKTLSLQVGYANTIKLPVPPNVQIKLPDQTHIQLASADKQAVGQFAAQIRKVRPPEPYKGKGIRYEGERVRRKAGKAFAGSGGK